MPALTPRPVPCRCARSRRRSAWLAIFSLLLNIWVPAASAATRLLTEQAPDATIAAAYGMQASTHHHDDAGSHQAALQDGTESHCLEDQCPYCAAQAGSKWAGITTPLADAAFLPHRALADGPASTIPPASHWRQPPPRAPPARS